MNGSHFAVQFHKKCPKICCASCEILALVKFCFLKIVITLLKSGVRVLFVNVSKKNCIWSEIREKLKDKVNRMNWIEFPIPAKDFYERVKLVATQI